MVAGGGRCRLRLSLYPREIFEQPSLSTLAAYLLAEMERPPIVGANEKAGDEEVANQPLIASSTHASLPPISHGKRNPAAIFLLSSPRSGSTLLRVMLAGHPSLFCPPELHLLPFDGMAGREAQLEKSYLGEGLQRAVMELTGRGPDESKALLLEWVDQDLPIQEVYSLLQEMAGVGVHPAVGVEVELRPEREGADPDSGAVPFVHGNVRASS